jgi:hypothetical protein
MSILSIVLQVAGSHGHLALRLARTWLSTSERLQSVHKKTCHRQAAFKPPSSPPSKKICVNPRNLRIEKTFHHQAALKPPTLTLKKNLR